MADIQQWEYRALSLGSALRSPSDEEIEAALNELGVEGWEVASVYSQASTNKVRIVAKRPLTAAESRRRNWPG